MSNVRIYIPSEVPTDYIYIGNITNNYFDIYNTSNPNNSTGVYYRVYYALDSDLVIPMNYNYTQYSSVQVVEINRTTDILSRYDNYKIFSVSFFIIIFIIFICNLFTSIVKKNGILGGVL